MQCTCNKDMFVVLRFQCRLCGRYWEHIIDADRFCPAHGDCSIPEKTELVLCRWCEEEES